MTTDMTAAAAAELPDPSVAALADAVPAGSRVLVVGDAPAGLAGELGARGCSVEVSPALGASVGTLAVDAVVIPSLSGPAVDGTLARSRLLVADTGRVVILLRNAAWAGDRLHLLRGDFDEVDIAALLLSMDAAEGLLAEAGLAVVERRRVTRAVELDAPTAVRQELLAHPEALTWAHVLVTVPVAGDDEARAGGAAVSALERRVAELEGVVDERERDLNDRIAELDAVHHERRHLELDLAVKEAFTEELQLRLAEAEAEVTRLRALVDAVEAEGQQREAWFAEQLRMTRYRIADAAHARIAAVPAVHRPLRAVARWQRERRGRDGDGG